MRTSTLLNRFPTPEGFNGHEAGARSRKAGALVDLIVSLPPEQQTVAAVSAWTEEQWRLAAGAADVRVPSEQTRAVVLERLRRIEARRAG